MKTTKTAWALLACLALPAALSAHPHDGVPRLNGGAGAEERAQMQASRDQYNVRLIFATQGSGAYRSDVDVEIVDAKGRSVLSEQSAGPMLYVQLPPGRYRLSASALGQEIKRDLRVGGSSQEMVLHWKDDEVNLTAPE